MKFSQRWCVIVALLFAFAGTVSVLTAQTEESSAVDTPGSTEVQSSSDEPEQKQPTLTPNRDTAADVETERRFNELRRELLDDREKTIDDRAEMIDLWLVVIAIVLTFFGIAIPIITYNRLNKLAESEKEARRYVKEIETIRDKVEIDRMISEAFSLQQRNRTGEAIEKWRFIANIKEETSGELTANAWFNIGYLLSPKNVKGEDIEGAVAAYNKAIKLNLSGPNLYWAYYNLGNAKTTLDQIEEAIDDYDKAIRLNPSFDEAYNNRGLAKIKLHCIDEARQDFEMALNLARSVGNVELMERARLNLENLGRGDAS